MYSALLMRQIHHWHGQGTYCTRVQKKYTMKDFIMQVNSLTIKLVLTNRTK